MTDYEVPQEYWESRLSNKFDLTGVGYASLGIKYNEYLYAARYRALLQTFNKTGIRPKGKSILEVGCGTGFYTEIFSLLGANHYTGLDITDVSTKKLQGKYPNYIFLQKDISAEQLSFDRNFDLVFAADVLFHIVDDKKFNQAIQNIGTVVKAGGWFILSDIFPENSLETAEHVNHRTMEEYLEILKINDFEVQHIEPLFAILHPPIYSPDMSLVWKLYADLWRYGISRIAMWNVFDQVFPRLLKPLDEKIFLPYVGLNSPSSKWLVAQKGNV